MATFKESRYGRFKPRKNQLPPVKSTEFLPLLPFPGLSTSDETRELLLSSAMSKGAEIAERELAKELAKKKLWIGPSPFITRLPTTVYVGKFAIFQKYERAEKRPRGYPTVPFDDSLAKRGTEGVASLDSSSRSIDLPFADSIVSFMPLTR